MAKPKPTKMLAVLGRCRRTGRWRLASRSSVLAVFGKCHLDMTHSFVDDKEKLKMSVSVIFGSATFILPDGAEVRPSGMALLASSMVDVPDHDDTSELPTLDIEWTCVFGRIRILSEDAVARLAAEQEQKQFNRAVKRAKKKGKPPPDAPVTTALATEPQAPAVEKPKPAQEPEPEPAPVGFGFEDVAGAEAAPVGVGFEDVSTPEPVVVGVGFEDVPAVDEPVVAGVGFEDVPAAEEPVVVGVGFEDVPAADEPVVAGVGFEDVPAVEEPAASDEADPVVMGVGFDDIADDLPSEPEEAAADNTVGDDAAAAAAAFDDAADEVIRPSVDLGFVDMDYDPDWVPEPAVAAEAGKAE